MIFPPGVDHHPNHFELPAASCWEAAMSRNIHLEEELKTLLFNFRGQIYLYHGPGHKKIDTKKLVEKFIDDNLYSPHENDFYFLDKNQIKNLEKGTINPFNIDREGIAYDEVLICESIFSLTKVYTNDGTTTGTISFKPELLLEYYDKIIVDFWSIDDNQSKFFSAPNEIKNDNYIQGFLLGSTKMNLIINSNVWKPTQAAQWFSHAMKDINFDGKLVCDMCCGTGVLGIAAGLMGSDVVCSDLNPDATKYSAINGKLNNILIEAYNGYCFNPFNESYYRKFDIILANLPSLPISRNSDHDPPSTAWNENGSNGRNVLDTILKYSHKFLKTNGKLVFSSFGHQDWSITEKYLNLFWHKWDVVVCKKFKLPNYYKNYAQIWMENGLVLIDKNQDIFDEFKVVVCVQE
ncbi:MAG: 50S ribosomal protein L11 methyltransferase [Cyanobacteria bacterium J06633_8]